MKHKLAFVNNEGFIDIQEFAGLVDISKVEFYSIDPLEDGTLILRFFDSNSNLVYPNLILDGNSEISEDKKI